jgi:sulfopyruvate decarboxylase TPP-binding subunit
MALTARRVLQEFVACGITHIVWLPDSEAAHMYNELVRTPQLKLITVAREGEAIAVATGLLAGGAKPIVQIQSTGYYESGDSVRGLALDLKLPLLMMLGYRGYKEEGMTDSAAVFLEPSLDTFGIPHSTITDDSEIGAISKAYAQANAEQRPTAVLIGKEYE